MTLPHREAQGRNFLMYALGGGVCFLIFCLSLFYGAENTPVWHQIILQLRLPRVILAFCVGGGLSVAGAVLQTVFRNPLAEPHMMGVSSTAAFGAVISSYFIASHYSSVSLILGAFGGALGGAMVLFAVMSWARTTTGLLMGGLILASAASMLMTLTLTCAPNPYALMDITFWLMGGLENRTFSHVWGTVPLMLLGVFLLSTLTPSLRKLMLGEEVAHSLGVRLSSVRLMTLWGVACVVGGSVAAAGMIGFVGLVVPHWVRPWVKYDIKQTLVLSFLGGGAFLMAADLGIRLLPTPRPLQLGVVTSLIGLPFFFHLVRKIR